VEWKKIERRDRKHASIWLSRRKQAKERKEKEKGIAWQERLTDKLFTDCRPNKERGVLLRIVNAVKTQESIRGNKQHEKSREW
jgi:hypothetical protein